MSDADESVVLGAGSDDSVIVEMVGYASREPVCLHPSGSFVFNHDKSAPSMLRYIILVV